MSLEVFDHAIKYCQLYQSHFKASFFTLLTLSPPFAYLVFQNNETLLLLLLFFKIINVYYIAPPEVFFGFSQLKNFL